MKESDGRGLKDPEGYKRKIEEREKAEERARAAGGGPEGGGLKVGQQRAKAEKYVVFLHISQSKHVHVARRQRDLGFGDFLKVSEFALYLANVGQKAISLLRVKF